MSTQSRILTEDKIFKGKITIFQYQKGYRFSVDAILLANFVYDLPEQTYLELGSGSGVISIILAAMGVHTTIHGIEIQRDLHKLSLKNISQNGFSNIEIIHDNLKNLKKHFPPGKLDMIFSNPPYRRSRTGRLNTHSEKAIARHEIETTVLDIAKMANYLLKPYGRLKLIYPTERLFDVLETLNRCALRPTRIQFIYPTADQPAKLFMVEGVKGGRSEPEILPPIVIHEDSRTYTPYLQQILNPELSNITQ